MEKKLFLIVIEDATGVCHISAERNASSEAIARWIEKSYHVNEENCTWYNGAELSFE